MTLLFALVACTGAADTAPTTPETPAAPIDVAVQLNWFPEPEFGGMYQAQEEGLYAQAGLKVDIRAGGAGTPVLPEVATGRALFGLSVADEVLLARAQGADIVAIFATYQTHPSCVMVHKARGVTEFSQLKGGTLALEDGIPFGQWLYKKFPFEGVTRVPYQGGVAAFLLDPNYAQQGYVTSEPVLAKKGGADPICLMVADTGFNPYSNVIITSSKTIAAQPDLVKKFVAATTDGWKRYIADGTKGNAKIASLNPALDAEVAAEMGRIQVPLIENEATAKSGLGSMDEARWTELSAQLVEIGALAAPADVKAAFTNEFIVE